MRSGSCVNNNHDGRSHTLTFFLFFFLLGQSPLCQSLRWSDGRAVCAGTGGLCRDYEIRVRRGEVRDRIVSAYRRRPMASAEAPSRSRPRPRRARAAPRRTASVLSSLRPTRCRRRRRRRRRQAPQRARPLPLPAPPLPLQLRRSARGRTSWRRIRESESDKERKSQVNPSIAHTSTWWSAPGGGGQQRG